MLKIDYFPLLFAFVVGLPAYGRVQFLPEIPCQAELVAAGLGGDLQSTLERLASQEGIKKALQRLSKTYRTGWERRGVPENIRETVLEHSHKVFKASLLIPATGLSRRKIALMSFFHDIAEYEVPDYAPEDGISAEQKFREERAAIRKLIRKMGDDGKIILDLWEEYAARKTPEAKVVSQLDKLDAAVQSFEYSKMGYDVSGFIPYTEGKLTDPVLIEIFGQLKSSFQSGNAYDLYFDLLKAAHI